MPKTLYIFSIFNIRMATENSQIMFFLNARWYDNCHNANKIVLSEVKHNEALLEPSYGQRPNDLFGQPNWTRSLICQFLSDSFKQ